MDDNTKNTPWFSIDMYYKGFHIKKSLPQNVKLDKVTKIINLAIKKGYEPSWNKATSEDQLDPTAKWPQIKKEGCQHPEDQLEERISNSEKNPGKKFMKCVLCSNFVRWA